MKEETANKILEITKNIAIKNLIMMKADINLIIETRIEMIELELKEMKERLKELSK